MIVRCNNMSRPQITEAAAVLRRGGVVCIPTETSYGLAVDALNARAVSRLARLKGRAHDSPIALIACDQAQAMALTDSWPARARELARAHWPGPLTLVVPARSGLPVELIGGASHAIDGAIGGTVGVRVSSHPMAAALARELQRPITATSANPSGLAPAMDVSSARAYFGDAIECYLDGGVATGGRPSTVVAIDETGGVRVLRRGPVAINTSAESP